MEKIKELLQQSLNIDFIAATLSNPREKDGLKKVKVRPILKKGVLLFQCENTKTIRCFMKIVMQLRRCLYCADIWKSFARCRWRQKQ